MKKCRKCRKNHEILMNFDEFRWIRSKIGTLGYPEVCHMVPTGSAPPLPRVHHHPVHHCRPGHAEVHGCLRATVACSPGFFWLQQLSPKPVHLKLDIKRVHKRVHKRVINSGVINSGVKTVILMPKTVGVFTVLSFLIKSVFLSENGD